MRLRLWRNCLGQEGAKQVAVRILRDNRSDEFVLDVRDNNIGAEGISALCNALMGKRVEELDVSENNIGLEGAKAISSLLLSSCHIRRLIVSDTNMGEEGSVIIGEALKVNTSLSSLVYSSLSLSDAFFKSLSSNCALKVLCLNHSIVPIAALGHLLRFNATLTTLELAHSQLGSDWECAHHFFPFLSSSSHNRSLRHLNMVDTHLGPLSGQAIARVLRTNHTLFAFYLRANHFGPVGQKAITEAIQFNFRMCVCFGVNDVVDRVCSRNLDMRTHMFTKIFVLLALRRWRTSSLSMFPKEIVFILCKSLLKTL